MAYYWFCTFVFHVLIPLHILFVVLLRPTLTSYTYFIVACLCPFFPCPDQATMKGKCATFMKIFILTALLNTVMFFAMFMIIYYPNAEEIIAFCDPLEKVLRQVGYIDILDLPSASSKFRWLAPEVIMLGTSVFFYFVLKKFTKGVRDLSLTEEMGLSEVEFTQNTAKMEDIRQRKKKKLSQIGKCVIIFLLCCAAIVKPSVFGAVYFLEFLCIITWWGFYRKLKVTFAIATLSILPLLFVHMTAIYAYQFQYVQEYIDEKGLLTRILNIAAYVSIKNCQDPREWDHNSVEGFYEGVVFLEAYALFNLIIHVSKQIFYDRKIEKELEANKWKKAFSMLKQKKTDEEIIAEKVSLMSKEELEGEAWRQKCMQFFYKIVSYFIQLSYLLCNVVLMIWGIAYLGWKTSVFLIWANCVWLMPKQKYFIHVSSPIIIFWAWFIMISAYVYSMRLTSDELPSSTSIVNWDSGVRRNVLNPFVDLFVQSLFTIICAVCLRQFMHERAIRKQRDDLVAVAGATDAKIDLHDNELFDRFQISFYAKRQFALYFIWILGIYLVTLPFWGRMSPIRSLYLPLAIMFILSFELLPFKRWKQFLWFYWWVCVIYGMIHLFVRYLYQYDKMLLANERLGLDYFFNRILTFHKQTTWTLFTRLLFPVALIIMLVIQIHFLQTIFNRITDANNSDYYNLTEDTLPEETDEDSWYLKAKRLYFKLKNFFCLICEFHLRKIILLVAMWEVVSNKGAAYYPVIVLITLYPFMGRYIMDNIVFHIISVYLQLVFVIKIIYATFVWTHHDYDVTCSFIRGNKNTTVTHNTMVWLGFIHEDGLRGTHHIDNRFKLFYISFVFLTLICIDKAVRIRQANIRNFRGLSSRRPNVMYPMITFENREDSLPNMIKYICNYGFYKFGIELTFVAIAFGMWMRMDLFFMIHGTILLLIFALPRKHLARLWLPLMILFIGLIPYQYFNAVGWYPSKCSISSFWNRNDIFIRIQKLLFMRNEAYPPIAQKIFFDMVVLLFMSRQWRVFLTERQYRGQIYPGGSNDSVIHLMEDKNFVNPVPDFITHQRNYLDALKKIVLCHTYYLTLIFMYLAGTENIGTYSFLYIILSVVYFWQGAEMFLYPITTVIRRQNYMISYTIIVMLLRMLNQIYSCVFIFQRIPLRCYWQYPFAFRCTDRFGDYDDVPDLKSKPVCEYTDATLGISWDWWCFCLLLCQRRLIYSYNFIHIVNDVKLYTILASRGAYFIHLLRLKKLKALEDEESQIRKNIDVKLKRIEANHRKIQGESYLQQRKKRHKATVRSGDYYLFDEIAKNDIHILPEKPPDAEVDDSDPLDPLPLSQLLILLLRTNANIVLEERKMRREMKAEKKGQKSAVSAKKTDGQSKLPIARAASSLFTASKPEKSTFWEKIKKKILLLLAIFESMTVSLTLLFNRASKEYQFIVREMYKERIKILKTPYHVGRRDQSQLKYWQPDAEYEEYVPTAIAKDDGGDDPKNLTFNIYGKLLIAFYYFLMGSTEWMCYLMIILNQLLWNNFFTIMLPIMVFCWGTLTTPKPTRTFWITVIYYVLVMIMVKAVFAIPYFEYNKRETNDPFYPPYLMGLSRNFEIYFTLTFFLILFLHRSKLKSMGLWKPTDHRKTYLHDGDYNLIGDKLVPEKPEDQAGPGPSRPRTVPTGAQSFSIQSTRVPFATYFPRSLVPGIVKYGEGIRSFIQNLIEPDYSVPKDYYTLMFTSDLIGLLILLFSFESFHSEDDDDDGLYEYLVENRIPGIFVLVILIQFVIMLVDRGIYLRKNRLMKLLFNTVLVLTYHIWLNIMVPLYTKKLMIVNPRVQAFYFFKCIYLLVSAYQVAAGYPPRIMSHCLWHSFSVFNRVGYSIYLKIPYIFQIRSAVDWTVTDTTLSFMDWFKMEEIISTIFEQKCQQEFEATFVHKAGTRRNRTVKYIMGTCIVLGLWMVIIAPLALFSMGQSVGKAVKIKHVKMELRIGRFEPIYSGYAVDATIHQFTEDEYDKLQVTFSNMKTSRKTFREFAGEDVHSVKFSSRSANNWDISPPGMLRMRKVMKSKRSITVRLYFSMLMTLPSGEETMQYTTTFSINPLPDTNRENLIKMLMFNKTAHPLRFKRFWPKFLELTREKEAKVIDGLLEPDKKRQSNSYRHMFLKLRHYRDQMWWEMREECNDNDINYNRYLKNIATSTCDEIILFTFSEKHFPSILGSITSNGILGMYLLYFFMIYDIVGDFFVKIDEIWIEDMPYCDRIWSKCLEVYVARDMKNFEMEEEMVAELLFIMRSHEITIKLTRPPTSTYDPTFITPTR